MESKTFEFTHRIDASHASPRLAGVLGAYFQAKSAHDPVRTTGQ